MKTHFLFLMMIGWLTWSAPAQESAPTITEAPGPEYEYCEMRGEPVYGGNKMTVTVDVGQERRKLEDLRLRDEETRKIRVFNSMIDALNLLRKEGWEFVQGYASFDGQYVMHHWILKREKR